MQRRSKSMPVKYGQSHHKWRKDLRYHKCHSTEGYLEDRGLNEDVFVDRDTKRTVESERDRHIILKEVLKLAHIRFITGNRDSENSA